MTSTSKTDRIAKNTLILYSRSLFVLLISLYTSMVVLEALGVVDYGIFTVVGGVISALSFVQWSIRGTYQRFFNVEMARGNPGSIAKQFKVANAIQFFLALLLVLLAETVGLWFVNAKLVIPAERMVAANWIYQAAIISSVFAIITSPFGSLITAHERMDLSAFISVLNALLRLGIVLLIKYVYCDKLVLYAILLLLVSVLDWVLYVLLTKRRFPESTIRITWDKKMFTSMVSFSGWVLVDSLSQMLKGHGLNIVLNLFFGPVVNSARGIAYQIMGAVNQFIGSFQASFRPQLTKSYAEGDYNYMKKLYYSGTKISYYLIFTISLPIILETEYILHLWLGNNVPDYTASFTRLVLITTFVSSFANPTSCIGYATGRIKFFTIIVSSIMLSIVPLAYLFLKLGGNPDVALWVSLIVSIIAQVVRLFVVNGLVDIDLKGYLKQVLIPTMTCTLIISVVSILPRIILNTSFLRFVVSAVTALVFSVIVIWLLGFNKEERTLLHGKVMSFFGGKKS